MKHGSYLGYPLVTAVLYLKIIHSIRWISKSISLFIKLEGIKSTLCIWANINLNELLNWKATHFIVSKYENVPVFDWTNFDVQCDNYVPLWWVEYNDELSWLFTNRVSATRYMKVKKMGITELLRRIWLFSANNIKSSESVSKHPTQLIVEINSSLWHIIVTQVRLMTSTSKHPLFASYFRNSIKRCTSK